MPLGDPPASLELRQVSVGYDGRTPIVHSASVTVGHREVLAVMGSNGSGKTTLIRGILGLAPVLSGEILVAGRPLTQAADRARIGYVPQRHTVGSSVPATVTEVVNTGRLARLGWFGRMKARDRQIVSTAIATVGLTDHAHRELSLLSGGQQRRALIARALAAEPDVLIMDEPLAGVDHKSGQTLVDALARLAAQGVPMVIVTHELHQITNIWTRAVVVEAGRLRPESIFPSAETAVGDQTDHHHLLGPHDHVNPLIGQPLTDHYPSDPSL